MKQRDWSEVTDKEIKDFERQIEKLKKDTLPRDADNDFPVDVVIIDRRKYERMHYWLVPYDYKAETFKDLRNIEKALLMNLDLAMRELQRFRELRESCDDSLVEAS